MAQRQQVELQIPGVRLQPQASPVEAYVRPNFNAPQASIIDLGPLSATLTKFFSDLGDQKYEENVERGLQAAKDLDATQLDRAQAFMKSEMGDATGVEAARRRALAMTKMVKMGWLPGPMATPGGQRGLTEGLAYDAADEVSGSLLDPAYVQKIAAVRTENGDLTQPVDTKRLVDEAFESLVDSHPVMQGSFYAGTVLRKRREVIESRFAEAVANERSRLGTIEKRQSEQRRFIGGWEERGLVGFQGIVNLQASELTPAVGTKFSEVLEEIELGGDPEALPNFVDALTAYALNVGNDNPQDAYKLLDFVETQVAHRGQKLSELPDVAIALDRVREDVEDSSDRRASRDYQGWTRRINQGEQLLTSELRIALRGSENPAATAQAYLDTMMDNPSWQAIYDGEMPGGERAHFDVLAEGITRAFVGEDNVAPNPAFANRIKRLQAQGVAPDELTAMAREELLAGELRADEYDNIVKGTSGFQGQVLQAAQTHPAYDAASRRLDVLASAAREVVSPEELDGILELHTNMQTEALADLGSLGVTNPEEIPGALETYFKGRFGRIDQHATDLNALIATKVQEARAIEDQIGNGEYSKAQVALERSTLAPGAKDRLANMLSEARRENALPPLFDLERQLFDTQGLLEQAYTDAGEEGADVLAREASERVATSVEKATEGFEGSRIERARLQRTAFRKAQEAELKKAGKDPGRDVNVLRNRNAAKIQENRQVLSPESEQPASDLIKAVVPEDQQALLDDTFYQLGDLYRSGDLGPIAALGSQAATQEYRLLRRVGAEALLRPEALGSGSSSKAFSSLAASVGLSQHKLGLDELLSGQMDVAVDLLPQHAALVLTEISRGTPDALVAAMGRANFDQYLQAGRRSALTGATFARDLDQIQPLFEKAGFTVTRQPLDTEGHNFQLRLSKTVKLNKAAVHPSLTRWIDDAKDFTSRSPEERQKILKLLGYDADEDQGQAEAMFLGDQRRLIEAQP